MPIRAGVGVALAAKLRGGKSSGIGALWPRLLEAGSRIAAGGCSKTLCFGGRCDKTHANLSGASKPGRHRPHLELHKGSEVPLGDYWRVGGGGGGGGVVVLEKGHFEDDPHIYYMLLGGGGWWTDGLASEELAFEGERRLRQTPESRAFSPKLDLFSNA